MIKENADLISRLNRIIEEHLELMDKSALIRNMVNKSGKDVETIAAILKAILTILKINK